MAKTKEQRLQGETARRQRAEELRSKHPEYRAAAVAAPVAHPSTARQAPRVTAQHGPRSRAVVGRSVVAVQRLESARAGYDRARTVRDQAMVDGLAAGLSPAAVGRALGISRQAVNQRVAMLGR